MDLSIMMLCTSFLLDPITTLCRVLLSTEKIAIIRIIRHINNYCTKLLCTDIKQNKKAPKSVKMWTLV
jgi:hypothetical protein